MARRFVPFAACARIFRRRVPVRLQFQTTECGIGALQAMLAYHGIDVPAEELRRVTGVSRDCMNARDVLAGARHYGLEARAFRREPDHLIAMALPAIVHVRFIHFMVLEAIDAAWVTVMDPASGRTRLSRDYFDSTFTGVVIDLRPAPAPAMRTATGAPVVRARIAGAPVASAPWFGRAEAGWCGAGIVAGLLAAAALIRAASGDVPAAGCFVLLALLSRGAQAYAGRTVASRLRHAVLRHLTTLPPDFWAYRLAHDVGLAGGAAREIAIIVHERLLPAALSGLTAAVLAGAAIWRAPDAGLAGCGLLIAATLTAAWLHGWHQGLPLARPPMLPPAPGLIEHMRLDARLAKFGEVPARLAPDSVAVLANRLRNALPALLRREWLTLCLSALEPIAAAIALAAQADVTETVMLLAAATSWRLCLAGLPAAPQLRAVAAKLRDVMSVAPEAPVPEAPVPEAPAAEAPGPAAPLPATAGFPALEVRDIRFGYAPFRPPILDAVSLVLQPSEQLGITGPSGQGKSTLGALAAGLLVPRAGMVLLEGRQLDAIPPSERAGIIGWVGREPGLFDATLADNLTLWDAAVPEHIVHEALRDAGLEDELAGRGGLAAWIGASPPTISQGQAQRLAIARALVRSPRILILDEALDSLDLALERRVRANLRSRGIALIVISHRAGTLAGCDRVMRIGRPVPGQAVTKGAFADGGDDSAPQEPNEPAAPADLLTRRVRLTDPALWRRDLGTLSALRRIDGKAVALEAAGSRYRLRLPDGATVRLTPAQAMATVHLDAWQYAPNETTMRGALRRLRGDLGMTMVANAAFGVAAMALAFRMARGHAGAGAVVAALAALPFLGAAGAAGAIRVRAWVSLAASTILVPRLSRLEAHFLGNVAPAWAAAASAAVADLVEWLGALPAQVARDTMLLALSCALLATPALLAAAGFGALAVATPVILVWCEQPAWRATQEAVEAERRFRATLLRHWMQLRSLGALPALLRALDRLDRAAWRGGTGVALRAIRSALPFVLPLAAVVASAPRGPADAAFTWIAVVAAGNLGALAAGWGKIAPGLGDLRSILAGPAETGADHPVPAVQPVALRDVSFAYPNAARPAVSRVSLTIAPGRIVAIAGASGSGKSTLLSLLLGLDQPSEGAVTVGGRPLATIDLAAWRRGIGAVLQESSLDYAGTIRGQVGKGTRHTAADVWDALRLAGIADEVAAMPMGLQSIVEYSGLSGGQLQRVMIAAALIQKPWLLVLDEATAAIPDDKQAALFATLRRVGIGCVIVTHRPYVLALADEVHIMAAGRLVFSGPPDSCLSNDDLIAPLREEAAEP